MPQPRKPAYRLSLAVFGTIAAACLVAGGLGFTVLRVLLDLK